MTYPYICDIVVIQSISLVVRIIREVTEGNMLSDHCICFLESRNVDSYHISP